MCYIGIHPPFIHVHIAHLVYFGTLVGHVAQWLGHRSLASRLSLIYALHGLLRG